MIIWIYVSKDNFNAKFQEDLSTCTYGFYWLTNEQDLKIINTDGPWQWQDISDDSFTSGTLGDVRCSWRHGHHILDDLFIINTFETNTRRWSDKYGQAISTYKYRMPPAFRPVTLKNRDISDEKDS